MIEIVVATRNIDKYNEIVQIMSDSEANFIFAGSLSNLPEILEDCESLYDNALKKAKLTADITGKSCLADDTGFFVRALNNKPGIYAARYAGENCSYEDNVNKLLSEMKNKTDSYAYFQTITVYYNPNNDVIISGDGILEGHIITEKRGFYGFGYDPIFIPLSHTKTLAEMKDHEKCELSHRYKSLDNLSKNLKKVFKEGKW